MRANVMSATGDRVVARWRRARCRFPTFVSQKAQAVLSLLRVGVDHVERQQGTRAGVGREMPRAPVLSRQGRVAMSTQHNFLALTATEQHGHSPAVHAW